jgi:hypothetical protein
MATVSEVIMATVVANMTGSPQEDMSTLANHQHTNHPMLPRLAVRLKDLTMMSSCCCSQDTSAGQCMSLTDCQSVIKVSAMLQTGQQRH